MTDTRFGASVGLLQRLRPARIDVAELGEVAEALLPCLATAGLRVHVVQRSGAESLLVMEEDERCVRMPLSHLADDMTQAGVRPTRVAISAALASWIAHRPVTDAAAAGGGIVVLDWATASRTAVGWRLVVRRAGLAVPWIASPSVDAPALHRIRSAAFGRSNDVRLNLRIEGPVALWSHPSVPSLASAALVAPERMIQRIAACGVAMDDMHVVVTPERPVACADRVVAARLAGETTEASVTLPWSRLAGLPWI